MEGSGRREAQEGGDIAIHIADSVAFVVQNQLSNAGHMFDPWVRKIPWRRKWQPTPVFCLENAMDKGAWQAGSMES